jgi:hypothetical protein
VKTRVAPPLPDVEAQITIPEGVSFRSPTEPILVLSPAEELVHNIADPVLER